MSNAKAERPTIVITHRVHASALELLAPHYDIIANETDASWPEEIYVHNLSRADAIIAFMPDRIDDAILQRAPRLKHIACCLKGYDNFDIDACTRRGVLISILPDLLTEPTAELAVGLMIAADRRFVDADAHVRSGEFQGWRPTLYGGGISRSTVGIVGFGVLGQTIAERLRAFRTSILYYDKKRPASPREADLRAQFVALPYLLAVSDFVVLAASIDAKTPAIISREGLGFMQSHAALINVARGSLVNEDEVATALAADRLRFYAADVFAFEDWARPDRPRSIAPALLAQRDRTLFTPHLGSAVGRVREEMELQSARNAIQFLGGVIPKGALNPEATHTAASAA